MERRDLKKQGLALGISISLVALIFFILIPPPTVTAVKVSAGDPILVPPQVLLAMMLPLLM